MGLDVDRVHNKPMSALFEACSWKITVPLFFFILLPGCGSWENVPEPTTNAIDHFGLPDKSAKSSSAEVIQAFHAEDPPDEYRLGDSDQITVDVVGRPELSGQHIIGPDGQITLPVAGLLTLRDMTRKESAQAVKNALSHYYKDIYATVKVDHYNSNKIIVLGRVEKPGVLQFDSQPNLLEILAKAGGLPMLIKDQISTRCSIIRGEKIIWVDLNRLLAGDLSLNIPLQRNDAVYIADALSASVFVLGAVGKPGAYRLNPQMSVLDAFGEAGGMIPDANNHQIHLIRPNKNLNLEIDFDNLITTNRRINVALESGDILFVPHNGIAKVGYILQKLNPFAQVFTIRQLAGMP